MAMIPHERSLVKRLEGKPFTIVGVNSDQYGDNFKKQMEQHQVTWRSFKNERATKEEAADKSGKEATPAIATEWNVQGWPTLYLIDHKGVIRKKWLGSPGNEVMDAEIEKLVKLAEETKPANR